MPREPVLAAAPPPPDEEFHRDLRPQRIVDMVEAATSSNG